MIDLSLDSFLIPDLIGYTLPFGTKITRTAENKGGLSTREVSNNVAMSFLRERSVVVSASDSTSLVESDSKLVINAASAITLTLNSAQYAGCKVTIINNTALTHTLSCTSVSTNTPHILPHAIFSIMWNGTAWQSIGGKNVGETYTQEPQQESPFDVFPCSDWVEIISHNGAFKRTANAPTTLYSLDGSKFYRDSELTNPVDFSGMLVDDNGLSVPAAATDSGNTVTNSKGQIVHIYTGNWTSGAAAAYIEKSDDLIKQKAQAPNIKGQVSSFADGNTNFSNTGCFEYYSTGRSENWSVHAGLGIRFDASRAGASVDINGNNVYYGDGISTFGELRPVNFTVKLWKRIA